MADEHIMHQGAANATPRLKDRSRSHYTTTTLRSTATTEAVTVRWRYAKWAQECITSKFSGGNIKLNKFENDYLLGQSSCHEICA